MLRVPCMNSNAVPQELDAVLQMLARTGICAAHHRKLGKLRATSRANSMMLVPALPKVLDMGGWGVCVCVCVCVWQDWHVDL